MKLLIDADSCPKGARDIVLRASARRAIRAVFAANRPIPGVGGGMSAMEVCPPGEGAADNRLVELADEGDIAVTRDIPLAERLVEKGVVVVDDRGRVYTRDNVAYLRSLRDFNLSLAENGLGAERSGTYGKKEIKAFADSLDRELGKRR